jgi:F0F1-type ATP synthase assembly protein I
MGGRKPEGTELGQAWRYDTLGYTFAFSVIIFAGIGFLLDRWLHTTPLITVIGTLLGAAMAFFWAYSKVRADEARYKAKHPRTGGGPKPPPSADDE